MKKLYVFQGEIVTIVWADDEADPHEIAVEDSNGIVTETTFDQVKLADYYRALASKNFGTPYNEVNDAQRRLVKLHSAGEIYVMKEDTDV